MSETPESKALTLDDLKSVLGEFKTGLMEEVNKTVSGMGGRLKKSLETEQQTQIEAALGKVLETVTKPAGEADPPGSEETKATTGTIEKPSPSDNPIENFQAMLQRQQQALDSKLAATEKQYQEKIAAMQKAVEDERLNTAKSQAQASILDPVRDRLHNPQSFWRDLEAMGVVYDAERKTYGLKGKDEFQNDTFTPLSQKMDDYLKADNLAYHVKARPGSGLNSQPNTSASPATNGNSAYSSDSKVDPATRFAELKRKAASGTDPLDVLSAS